MQAHGLYIFLIISSAILASATSSAGEFPRNSIDLKRPSEEVPTRSIEPPPADVKKGTFHIDRDDLNRGRPNNPDELFACLDAREQTVSEGPVCAHEIRTIYCIRAPCPPAEKWVSYPNANEACTSPEIVEYARDRCRNN